VAEVTKKYLTGTHAGFALPVSAAPTTAMTPPATTGAVAAVAGDRRRFFTDVAPVCAHTATTDVFVLEGAFPGTSVWSPPI
jgi:hypothetical protein